MSDSLNAISSVTINSGSKSIWDVLTGFSGTHLVLILVMIFFVLFIFVLITNPIIKTGKNSFILFNSQRRSNKSPHVSCPYNIDFFHIVTKTTEIVTKICYLENIELIDRQMAYVEQKLLIIKSVMMQNYAKLLYEKLGSNNVTAHEDYILYNRLVQSMLREDIKVYIKQSLLNDDFINMSDTEFKVYLNDKFEYLYQIGSQFMDIWYISARMTISREELRVSVELLKSKLADILSDVYNKAIVIINEVDKEKESLKKELDNFCIKIIGIHTDDID